MLTDFISLFFPNCCQICQNALVKGEDLICIKCEYELPRTNSHYDPDNFISGKFYGKVRLEYALAYYSFIKGGKVSKLLWALKYKNVPELGVLIGQKYATELKKIKLEELIDVIVPVPLHKSKLRRRGYNQSERFAAGLASVMNIDLNTVSLIRTTATNTQTNKTRVERWKNVEGRFKVTNSEQLKNKRVLLVDDVVTTGSTLEACVQEIVKAGCDSISIAAIAAAR